MANMNFGVNIIPKVNNTYTLGNSDYKWNIFANALNGISLTNIITDIQINGTSILSNNIADIPIATWNTPGVVKAGADYGVGMLTGGNAGIISVQKAGTDVIKAGTNIYRPIVPYNQHESIFYGLAKAAGDSTQSASSNAVGTYTDGAKTAIQNMLNVAPTANPVFTGSISLGRAVNSTIGENSFASGYSVEASGNLSHAEGSHTTASGGTAHAEGGGTTASGASSHAEGMGTTASGAYSHVSGQFNVEDSYSNWPEWVANTSYSVGDKVKLTSNSSVSGYICKTANSDSTFTSSNWTAQSGKMNYAEIIGNGLATNNKSNARVLDWDGNERLKGNIYIGCNADSTGGTMLTPPVVMTGATSSAAGTAGYAPAPATTDVNKFLAGDGTYKSGGLPMVILSYGNSTWAEFKAAYNNNVIVYCRASSNSNPTTGSQTRMAFMAYVNNATTPTEVEFQYYRSMSSHSATAMGDQVFVYKLTKTGGWSVTTRDASIKQIKADTGTALGVSWSSNVVTLTNTMTADDMPMSSSDATTAKSAIDGKININQGIANAGKFLVVNSSGNVEAITLQAWQGGNY